MTSRVRGLIRSVARGVLTATIAVTTAFGSLLAWAGSAAAELSGGLAQTPSGVAPFGLVGLVAVVLGVAGMIAGFARRRREVTARAVTERRAAERAAAARAAQCAHPEDHGGPIPAPSQPPLSEQPTRRFESLGRSRAA